jgi:GLPGLI family protein
MDRLSRKDCYEQAIPGGKPAIFGICPPDNKIQSFTGRQNRFIPTLLQEGIHSINLLKIITIMKSFILLSAGLILSAMDASAQRPDTAQVLVHYKFSHVRDTTNRGNPYTENMVLLIGKQAGVYRSYDHQLSVAQDKKKMKEAIANSAGGPLRINRQITGSATEYYQYPNDKKMLRKESLFAYFLVTGALPVINWQISGDTASFGGLHCQKATGHFKGRDYTAWFCPDLLLHIGPWELNGLPGVIVEAYDATGDVRFTFDGMEKAVFVAKSDDQPASAQGGQGGLPPMPGMEDDNTDPDIIKVPDNATKTTDKEFAKLEEACRKDPNAFAQSMMAARSGGAPGAMAGGPAGGQGPKMKMDFKAGPTPVINNPIELAEKQ